MPAMTTMTFPSVILLVPTLPRVAGRLMEVMEVMEGVAAHGSRLGKCCVPYLSRITGYQGPDGALLVKLPPCPL
jgi:hypothetical protein